MDDCKNSNFFIHGEQVWDYLIHLQHVSFPFQLFVTQVSKCISQKDVENCKMYIDIPVQCYLHCDCVNCTAKVLRCCTTTILSVQAN